MNPAVFLHGFLGAPAEWSPVLQELQGIPCQTPALPMAADWISGVEALLERLPGRSHLIGYSMGGRLAIGCAIAAPDRFKSLVLVSCHPGLEKTADRCERRERDDRLADELIRTPAVEFLTKWYDQPLFAAVTPSIKAQWIVERESMDRAQQAQWLRAFSVSAQPDYWPHLRRLKIPVTFVAGERDNKYRRIAERLRAEAPSITIEIVPNVGHAVHREVPQTIGRLLRQRLAKSSLEETQDE